MRGCTRSQVSNAEGRQGEPNWAHETGRSGVSAPIRKAGARPRCQSQRAGTGAAVLLHWQHPAGGSAGPATPRILPQCRGPVARWPAHPASRPTPRFRCPAAQASSRFLSTKPPRRSSTTKEHRCLIGPGGHDRFARHGRRPSGRRLRPRVEMARRGSLPDRPTRPAPVQSGTHRGGGGLGARACSRVWGAHSPTDGADRRKTAFVFLPLGAVGA